MSFLHPLEGKEKEFNAAVDEWEAFAATKRGMPEWERFPFMVGVSKVPVPAETKPVAVAETAPSGSKHFMASIPTTGPAVFAPPVDATREDVGAAVKEAYATYEEDGVAAKRYKEIMQDETPYMKLLRARFDLAIARAFGSKHVGICAKAREAEWSKAKIVGADLVLKKREFALEMKAWEVKHLENLARLESVYQELLVQNAEDGVNDGVDLDQLTASIAQGKLEKH